MSYNFRILSHQNSESLHLKLLGDFDGSSACELVNALNATSKKANRVFIHTEGLKNVNLFGELVFQNGFNELSQKSYDFVLTGDKLVP